MPVLDARTIALFSAAVATATIAGAWGFQLAGYAPCPLCLEQRWPYYIGIPLALATAFAAHRQAPACVVQGGLLLIALCFVWSVTLGAYHVGVEWKWIALPEGCTTDAGTVSNAGSLLEALDRTRIPKCDEVAWSLFGISMAGYNTLISAGLAALALFGATRPYGSSSVSQ